MTGTRRRIDRNRRKRIHAAELRRHEMEVDGVATLQPSRHEVMPTASAATVDRETEERKWLKTWEVE